MFEKNWESAGTRPIGDFPSSSVEAEDKLWAELQETGNQLRAEVLAKMTEYFDIHSFGGDWGWAIFSLDADPPAERDPVPTGRPDRFILIMVQPGNGQPVPDIRIISNEFYPGANGKKQFLSTDFGLRANGDALYNLDAAQTGQKVKTSTIVQLTVDEEYNLQFVGNFLNDFPAERPFEYAYLDDELSTSFPYGIYDDAYDGLYAVSVGQEMFNQVKYLEPAYYSPMPEYEDEDE
jgi:hypothetical protein